jgi:soluble lytic murein transglycosylase-like protein
MKSVYALIPAALLAGTVLSAPVEAKRMEDPSVHAERLEATQKYFKNKAAKRPDKTIRVGSIERRKAERVADNPLSEARKTASAKGRKLKLAAVKKHRPLTVAAAKQPEIRIRKMAHLDATSMSKVLRSGPRPRDLQNLAGAKTLMSEQAMQAVEGNDERVISVIREMAPSYGVPTWFALRIANVESGYNPYVRGRAGEIGIYQLKCDTARGMGFSGNCSDLTDVRTNVRWGLKHLSLAIQSSNGDLQLAASKHNGGLGRKSLVLSYVAKVF